MDTQMDAVIIGMVTTNNNIGNLYNSVNHMSHMLVKFMREMKQGNILFPTEFANTNNSTKVISSATHRNESIDLGRVRRC